MDEKLLESFIKPKYAKWKIVIEGRSSFTQAGRFLLEKLGVIFVKDVSANKGIMHIIVNIK